MAIVVRLDVALAKRKMQSKELAERLGVTVQTMSRLKRGKMKAIRVDLLDALCRELNCEPGDLLEYVPDDGLDDEMIVNAAGAFMAEYADDFRKMAE